MELDLVAHALTRTDPVNGDDAAVLHVAGGRCCISTDSTVAGVHAPLATPPHALGRRAVARALSDLAAMGAAPLALTCAVLVPDDGWADAAAALDGAAARAAEQHAPFVGGDVARAPGPLALVVTVVGRPAGARWAFVSRAGLRPGDELWVTGTLGAAGAALAARGDTTALLPEPPDRIRAGIALAPHARAMLDLSDGIARDTGHMAHASGCGATVDLDLLPLAPGCSDPRLAAAFGDDYELLVALAPGRGVAARAALDRAGCEFPLTRVGIATDADGGTTFLLDGSPVAGLRGFEHR